MNGIGSPYFCLVVTFVFLVSNNLRHPPQNPRSPLLFSRTHGIHKPFPTLNPMFPSSFALGMLELWSDACLHSHLRNCRSVKFFNIRKRTFHLWLPFKNFETEPFARKFSRIPSFILTRPFSKLKIYRGFGVSSVAKLCHETRWSDRSIPIRNKATQCLMCLPFSPFHFLDRNERKCISDKKEGEMDENIWTAEWKGLRRGWHSRTERV